MAAAETYADIYERSQSALSMDADFLLEQEIDKILEAEQKLEAQMTDEQEIEYLLGESDGSSMNDFSSAEITPSEFTEFAIKIPVAGKIEQFSFGKRRYLKEIYDTGDNRVLLKAGRQVEKSTLLGNVCLSYTAMVMAFKVLYVTATAQQATVFSVDRIREPMELSPVVSSLTTTKLAQNVFFKQLLNRSQIRIRYAFLSADRVRGISADKILIDEIQDILAHNIPVIEQCASHSPWKIYRYSGTPKSMDNTIQIYWDQYSTQNEWAVPCDRHTPRHWNILGEKNIGRHGLICAKCGKPIHPNNPDALWVSMQPRTPNNEDRVTFQGFRVPQLMVPWIVDSEEAWDDQIIFAHKRYDRAKFHNEVLGLSYDSGARPLTRAQVQACCQEDIRMAEVVENAKKCNGGVYAGIDWGIGENESYTVISLGGYLGKEFQIFYSHRFTGQDIEPPVQLEKIAKMFVATGVRIAGTDYGVGFDRNDWLARNFGPHRIRKIQYVGKLKRKVKWEPEMGRFVVHRTEIMSDIFNAIKRKQIFLPKFEEYMDPHVEDLLNIFSEYNEMMRMIQYKLSPGKSDDTFHSIVYCFLAAYLEHPRPDILIPVRSKDVLMPT